MKEAQISSYKISHKDVMYSLVIMIDNTILHIRKLLKVNLENSHKKKIIKKEEENYNCEMMDIN